MGASSLGFSAVLGAAGGITMGMVLERAGGWKSITEFVQTNGYSLQTLNSLYSDKLKPSFETIFPPKTAEGTPAREAAAVEVVVSEAAPSLLEKDIVIPFTGKTVPAKAALYLIGSIGVGYAAYRVAVQMIGKKKVDMYVEKAQAEATRLSSRATASVGAAYAQATAKTTAAYQATKLQISATTADLYAKSGLQPQVERALVALEPVTGPLRAQTKAAQAEMVRRLAPTASWCSTEGAALLTKLLAALSAAAAAAKLRAKAAAEETGAAAAAVKQNVQTRLLLAKARAASAAGDALFAASQQLKAEPQVLVSKSVARFLMDLRNDLDGSPDRAALEEKYPQLLQELEVIAAAKVAVLK